MIIYGMPVSVGEEGSPLWARLRNWRDGGREAWMNAGLEARATAHHQQREALPFTRLLRLQDHHDLLCPFFSLSDDSSAGQFLNCLSD